VKNKFLVLIFLFISNFIKTNREEDNDSKIYEQIQKEIDSFTDEYLILKDKNFNKNLETNIFFFIKKIKIYFINMQKI
jgi:hypothetical protein